MPWSFEAAARYGWTPDEELSEDENVMDLVLLVTRTSRLRQGGMACVLVRPPEDPISCDGGGARHNNTSLLRGRIAVVATNGSLYEADSSDIHAEIAAVATAAGHGIPTRNATAYITMPPCKRCFAALVMSGVRRVVSRHPCRSAAVQKAAFASGVELVVQEETAEQRGRLASLAKGK
jgi:deoxycytidylate deaminase